MQIRNGIIEAIGHTPLMKLKRASEATGCTILGKAEFMNPGGSVKDRAGRQMILEAEKRGELRPGGLVVEATAGNTGIGLALVANARGYRTLIVIPETQSQEKKDMLRLCGAELVEVPAAPYSNPNNYQHVGRRLAEQLRRPKRTASSSPTSGTISTTARLTTSRPVRKSGKSATDNRRLHLRHRYRRHDRRRLKLPARKEQRHHNRRRRSTRLRRCIICSRTARRKQPKAAR